MYSKGVFFHDIKYGVIIRQVVQQLKIRKNFGKPLLPIHHTVASPCTFYFIIVSIFDDFIGIFKDCKKY